VLDAAQRRLLASAQDVSGGGLAVALAECAMWAAGDRGLGATVRLHAACSPAAELFGESPSRIVVSCRRRHASAVVLLARQHGLPVEEIGVVGGSRLVIELTGAGSTGAAEERGSRVADAVDVPLAALRHAWDHGLGRALGWEDR
jgi:phosphoribosylformylglycinamidine synthase subunit PurL